MNETGKSTGLVKEPKGPESLEIAGNKVEPPGVQPQ